MLKIKFIVRNKYKILLFLLILLAYPALAENFVVPSVVKHIEEGAFEGDVSLKDVILPDALESIGSRAFAHSTLKSVNLPASLISIADDAFEGVSDVTFTAQGSYAQQWLIRNHYALGFTEEKINDIHAQIGIQASDEIDGIVYEDFSVEYEIAEYDYLWEHLNGKPTWTVEKLEGLETSFEITPDDEGRRAVLRIKPPAAPGTSSYAVLCTWDDLKVTGAIQTQFVELDPFRYQINISDVIYLKQGEETVLPISLSDVVSGYNARTTLSDYSGEADIWNEDDKLHILPENSGCFTGTLNFWTDNVCVSKTIDIYVLEAGDLFDLQVSALKSNEYRISWMPVECFEEFTVKWYDDADGMLLLKQESVMGCTVTLTTDVNTPYWFAVEHVENGVTFQSDLVCAEPLAVLDAPKNLSVTLAEDGNVLLSWDAVEGAQGYYLYYQIDDAQWTIDTPWLLFEEPMNNTCCKALKIDYQESLSVWICAISDYGPNMRSYACVSRTLSADKQLQFLAEHVSDDPIFTVDLAFPLIDEDGVEDETFVEWIQVFNKRQKKTQKHYEAMEAMVRQIEQMAETLKEISAQCSTTYPEWGAVCLNIGDYTYSFSGEDLYALHDGYEIVDAKEDNDAFQLKWSDPSGKVCYTLLTERGLTAAEFQIMPEDPDTGEGNLQEAVSMLSSADKCVKDILDAFQQYCDAAEILRSYQARQLNDLKVACDEHMDYQERLYDAIQSMDTNEKSLDSFIRVLQMWRPYYVYHNLDRDLEAIKCGLSQLEDLFSIKCHEHPTEYQAMMEEHNALCQRLDWDCRITSLLTRADVSRKMVDALINITMFTQIGGESKEINALQGLNTFVEQNSLATLLHDNAVAYYEAAISIDGLLHNKIHGRVVDADTGIALAGVTVRCMVKDHSPIEVITGTTGTFEMEPLGTNATLEFLLENYDAKCLNVSLMGDAPEMYNVSMYRSRCMLMGTVINAETGEPILNGTVTCGDVQTFTDAEGNYSLTPLTGAHTLTVAAENFLPQTISVEVEADEPCIKQILLEYNTTIPPEERVVYCFGDSITAGYGTTKTYHMFWHDWMPDWHFKNYAIAGTGYIRTKKEETISGEGKEGLGISRPQSGYNGIYRILKKFPDEMPYIIISGGSNDFNAAYSLNDFKEYVEKALDCAKEKTSNILVLLPIRRIDMVNREGLFLEDYCDVIRQACIKRDIVYASGFDVPIDPTYSEDKANNMPDGLHPNATGHLKLATAFFDELVKVIDNSEMIKG